MGWRCAPAHWTARVVLWAVLWVRWGGGRPASPDVSMHFQHYPPNGPLKVRFTSLNEDGK